MNPWNDYQTMRNSPAPKRCPHSSQSGVLKNGFPGKLAVCFALLAALPSASTAHAGSAPEVPNPLRSVGVVSGAPNVTTVASSALSGRNAASYSNFSVCVYFRYQEVSSIPRNLAQFAGRWADVEKQVKVSKVYLETTRNNQLGTAEQVEALKVFFTGRGIKVSGAMGLTTNEPNGFPSFDYSSQTDRDRVKAMTEFTAQHFDEIILDDFYFSNNKGDDAIAAKGGKSWMQFRTELMDEVSSNLIVGPARAVNPKVRVIIKYPNWYESFQSLGYDLAVEPKIFDAIYTGTETRNAESGQRLQSYQSYLQTEYFCRIKPGGNQGGWIDGSGSARYAEQFWDTLFAKVPEITLFNSQQIMGGAGGGFGAPPAEAADTEGVLANVMAAIPQPDGSSYTPTMTARYAGFSAELLDRFIGKLGNPVGIPTYKPCNSVGEEYLPDYLGMVGIPIDLVPSFPTNAGTVFLTAASRFDPNLVAKTKAFVQQGGVAIATTGLMEALGDKGFQDIAEIEVTGHRVLATGFGRGGRGGIGGGRGGGGEAGPAAASASLNMLLPQMRHFENDTWTSMEFTTAGSGYPMLIRAVYGTGTFYALALPDDFADIYRLPRNVLNQLRTVLGRDLFVSIDAPDHVSLFVYDNNTFIVQNFQAQAVTARATVRATLLHDLLSDKTIAPSGNASGIAGDPRRLFEVPVPAHSFRVFAAEQETNGQGFDILQLSP